MINAALVIGEGSAARRTASASGVTSVALSLAALFTMSGSPVTTAGTITGTLIDRSANTVFAGPTTGVAAAPSFRTLVADDIPSIPTSKISSGQLGVAFGGTGVNATSAANGSVLIGNGTNFSLATISAGSGITVTNGAGTITIAASGGGSTFADSAFRVQDNADATKQLAFEVSSVNTATTRTVTMVNRNITLDTITTSTSTSGFTNTGIFVNTSSTIDTRAWALLPGTSSSPMFQLGDNVGASQSGTGINDHIYLYRNISGTPTDGTGTGLLFLGKSTTTVNRDMGRIAIAWTDATDATRTSRIVFQTVNSASALTERLRIGGDGLLTSTQTTTVTSSTVTTFRSTLNSSGTPAAGYGQRFIFAGNSSTTNDLDMSYIESTWHTATHASRQSRLRLYVSYIGVMKQALDLSYGAGITLGYPSEDNTIMIPGSSGGYTSVSIGDSQSIKLWLNGGASYVDVNTPSGSFKINGVQVVGARLTGWSAWTGTFNRASKDTATATLTDALETIHALISDMMAHGLLGT